MLGKERKDFPPPPPPPPPPLFTVRRTQCYHEDRVFFSKVAKFAKVLFFPLQNLSEKPGKKSSKFADFTCTATVNEQTTLKSHKNLPGRKRSERFLQEGHKSCQVWQLWPYRIPPVAGAWRKRRRNRRQRGRRNSFFAANVAV